MLRSAIGIVVGIAIAILTVMLMEWISHLVFPPPPGVEAYDSEELAAYMKNAPIGALLIVVVGYIIATFDGVFVACLIGRAKPVFFALVVGIVMLAATTTNLILIPHPTWFSITAIAGIIVAAWLAAVLARLISVDHKSRI